MFLLGSTFFVAYGAWPTAYMLMIVLSFSRSRGSVERRLTPATALCIGLVAATGLIGVVFALVVLVAYFAIGLGRSALGRAGTTRPLAPPAAAWAIAVAVLLAAPLGVVVVGQPTTDGRPALPVADLAQRRASPAVALLERHPSTRSSPTRTVSSTPRSEVSRKPLVGIAESGLLAPGVSLSRG